MSASVLRQGHLLSSRLLGSASEPAPANHPTIRLEHPGGCPKEPVVYFNLFDNSGSMSGGNDPIGNRFEEVRVALQHLARYCRCGQEYSTIIHFDTPTSGYVLPTKLNRGGLSKLDAGLMLPPDGAGISLLKPSLDRAVALAASQPDITPVLTVLSDFELFDQPSVLDALIGFPGLVHAVVFRSQPPPLLLDAPDVLVTGIQPTDAPGAVARAIFESMTSLRRTPRRQCLARTSKGGVSWDD